MASVLPPTLPALFLLHSAWTLSHTQHSGADTRKSTCIHTTKDKKEGASGVAWAVKAFAAESVMCPLVYLCRYPAQATPMCPLSTCTPAGSLHPGTGKAVCLAAPVSVPELSDGNSQ